MPGIKTLFKLISFFIASYLLIHVMAIFGIFVAGGYLLWWFFIPSQVPCFYCLRNGNARDSCKFCRVNNKSLNLDINKKALGIKSVLFNMLGIVFLTLFSAVLVFGEANFLFNVNIFASNDQIVTFLLPQKNEYMAGQIFSMSITATGIKKSINAVEIDLSFNPKILQVKSIDSKNSFATIFVSKIYNNNQGTVHIVAGTPNPGFTGTVADIADVYFIGIAPGVTNVSFMPQSEVLANDGKGTNLLQSLPSAQFFIKPLNAAKTSLEINSSNNSNTRVLGASTVRSYSARSIPIEILKNVDQFTVNAWRTVFVK